MRTMNCYYLDDVEDFTLIIGEVERIKAVYRSMVKAWERGVSIDMKPMLYDARDSEHFPKFRVGEIYGIFISSEDFHVINADTVLRYMLNVIDGKLYVPHEFKN